MGLKTILLLAAVIVFIVAIFVDKNQVKWLSAGLAVLAGAFLLGELSGGGGFGARMRRRL
jgi:hypothetical protein